MLDIFCGIAFLEVDLLSSLMYTQRIEILLFLN
jgi:hypothetical protein